MATHPATTTSGPVLDETPEDKIVRLNVNLSTEVADALRQTTRRNGLTLTEGVRRAVSIWKLLDDAARRGERIEVVDPESGRTRELILGL
jgi:hypothetical protein